MKPISFLLQDITTISCDAIVNAANEDLLGGGGVDGAIHHASGPKLLEECRGLGGCLPGEAKITKGYRLPSKHVIHTVGPRYFESPNPEETLANCYTNCLALAESNGLKSIAFPSISTGVFLFPLEKAAPIAIQAIEDYFLNHKSHIEKVAFCFISKRDQEAYMTAYATMEKQALRQ